MDKLPGFVAVIHPQREKLRHAVELAGMYVALAFRRRGFGCALLKASMAHAYSIVGVRQIKLGVNATNTGARALYQSIGFASYGVEPDALQVDGMLYGEEHYMFRLNTATDKLQASQNQDICQIQVSSHRSLWHFNLLSDWP